MAGVHVVSKGRKSHIALLRSRFDIMANVLSAAVPGRTKTYLMRRCNLSYRQLQAYLGLLCERGLLREESHNRNSTSRKVFVTTEKGKAYLRAYGNLKANLSKSSWRFHLAKIRPQAQ